MSFLQGYFAAHLITSLIKNLFRLVSSLLSIFWVRLLLLCGYLYHSYIRRLVIFSLFESPFLLIIGSSVRPILFLLWFFIEFVLLYRVYKNQIKSSKNFYFKISMLVLIPLATVFIYDIPSNFSNKFVKTTTTLNFRKKGSINSGIIKTIPRGATLMVLQDDDNWKQVVYKLDTGFVSSKYVYSLQ